MAFYDQMPQAAPRDSVLELARLQLVRDMWVSLEPAQRAGLVKELFAEGLRYSVARIAEEEIKTWVGKLVAAEMEARRPEIESAIKAACASIIEKYQSQFKLKSDFREIDRALSGIKAQVLEGLKEEIARAL